MAYVQTDCTQANKSFVRSVSLEVAVRILHQSSPINVADRNEGNGEGSSSRLNHNVAKSDHKRERDTILKTVKIIYVNC